MPERPPEPAGAESDPERINLENRTVSRLSVRARSGRISIPPLGTHEVDAAELENADIEAAVAALAIRRSDPHEGPTRFGELSIWPAGAVFFGAIAAASTDADLTIRIGGAAFAAVGVIGLVVLAIAASFNRKRVAAMLASIAPTLASIALMLASLPRRLLEKVVLGCVAAIAVAAPGAVLYFGSDVPGLLDKGLDDRSATIALIGIAVQLLSVVGASALPVALYFVFDREKLKTLRAKFVRHIFRLDPAVRTCADVDVKYGPLLDEAYGRRTEERLLPGARSPILLATGVMALGWTIALLDANAIAQISATDQPIGARTLTDLLTPIPTPSTYAFLGAYFFTLQHVMRGYVRGDLRPKTYAQVAARTIGVVILAFVLEHLVRAGGGASDGSTVLVLAFVAGVVPESVLIRLQDVARIATRSGRSRSSEKRVPSLYETDPLTHLEGIDIYDRARLLDEGISNVEGLAHHDLVELMLKTRIPASRLVDWVDQAILYIHCPGDDDEDAASGSVRRKLRSHGIRTATDLQQAHAAACARNREKQFLSILDTPPGKPPVLRVILDTIGHEDWMQSLRYWHEHPPAPIELRIPEDLPAFTATAAAGAVYNGHVSRAATRATL